MNGKLRWQNQQLNPIIYNKWRTKLLNGDLQYKVYYNSGDLLIKNIAAKIKVPVRFKAHAIPVVLYGLHPKDNFSVEVIYENADKKMSKRLEFLSTFVAVNKRSLSCVPAFGIGIGLTIPQRKSNAVNKIQNILNFIAKGDIPCAVLQAITV